MWQSTATAPFDRNLQLAVIDPAGDVYALVFLCRRMLHGWVKSQTGSPVHVYPTHWREWVGIIERAPLGEPEQERLDVIKEYADDLRAFIKKGGESLS